MIAYLNGRYVSTGQGKTELLDFICLTGLGNARAAKEIQVNLLEPHSELCAF